MPYVVPYDMVITDVVDLPYVAPHVALYVVADILCSGFYQNPLKFFPLVQRVSSLKHVMKSTTKKEITGIINVMPKSSPQGKSG